ncbi:hypothetical protein BGW39_006664 [Mortierella sp. 14UC]|nr:hypothetical protein BGW39_006664 [Mortierella sp. 14UC]
MDHSMASGFKPGLGSAVWSPDLTPMSEPQYIGALIGLFLLSIGFRALVAAQGYLEAYLHLHYYPRPSHSSYSSHSSRDQASYMQQHNPSSTGQDATDSDDDEEGHRLQRQQQHLGGNSIGEDTRIGLPNGEKNDLSLNQQGQGMHHQQQQSSVNTPTRGPKRYGTNNRHNNNPPPFYAQNAPAAPSSLPFLTFPTAQPFIWQAEVSRAVLTTAVVGIGYMLMLVIMTYNSAYLGVILAGVFVGEVYFARWGRVRPVFPSTSGSATAVGRAPKLVKSKHQQSSDGTAPGGGAVARTAAMSNTSLASSTSSHGYSTSMAHHGLSGDGSC